MSSNQLGRGPPEPARPGGASTPPTPAKTRAEAGIPNTARQPAAQDARLMTGIAPGAPVLRDYQVADLHRVEAEIAAGRRRVLLTEVCGAGKTVIAAAYIAKAVARGERVLFLAHRRELTAQGSNKLYAAGIVDQGIIQAGLPMHLDRRVQVASIATLHARAVRGSKIELPSAELVIVDEAHHSRARTWRLLLDAYPKAAIVGLTATPTRGDGRGLGDVFQALVTGPPVADLIPLGYLVGTRVYAPCQPDLRGVRIERGDYVERDLARRMDTQRLVGGIVEHWLRLAERRKTVVFASGVGHSRHLRDEFRASGVRAEHIDGSTPVAERDAILAGLTAGTVELVVNCMVLTEGWDQPEVSCLVLARPTRNMGLYRQMVGRGLRVSPDKLDCLVLDHAGAVFQHGFVEDPVHWTLEVDRRAESPAHKARAEHKAPPLTTCPECFAILRAAPPCSACGWRPRPKPVAVEVADGELGRVDRARRAAIAEAYGSIEKHAFHRMLAAIAAERGYQPGWISHKYREKFGDWPPLRYVEPIEPDAATRAWVRSRQIAYAKSMQRQAAP